MAAPIAIILGSTHDEPVLEKVLKVLDSFPVEREIRVLSAHRTPRDLEEYLTALQGGETRVVITICGKAAHLPGVVASRLLIPVIGVPVGQGNRGLEAMLSMTEMPAGVPVAVVGINAGENAALLALQILAGDEPELKSWLARLREESRQKTLAGDREFSARYARRK